MYRHGVRQLRSAWADGPAYVTQCPIQKGHTYVYNFTIVGQRGTLWWHAHISWLRSTVYGAIVILPKLGVPYPFAKPYKEVPIIFGTLIIIVFYSYIVNLNCLFYLHDFTKYLFEMCKVNGGKLTQNKLLVRLYKLVEDQMFLIHIRSMAFLVRYTIAPQKV